MRHSVLFALSAAALFGVSTPVAKLLVGEISPLLLGGLLYLGSGLGLAIADRIAKLHHGKLQLINRPEGGLEARLTIPIKN